MLSGAGTPDTPTSLQIADYRLDLRQRPAVPRHDPGDNIGVHDRTASLQKLVYDDVMPVVLRVEWCRIDFNHGVWSLVIGAISYLALVKGPRADEGLRSHGLCPGMVT
jgi:hypothetical protein